MTRHDSDELWSLARGRLGADEAVRVRAHLAGCATCAALYAQMQAAVPALAAHVPPRPDDALFEPLDASVLAGAERALAPRGPVARGLAWASLGGVLAVAAVWLVLHLSSLDVPAPQPIARDDAPAMRDGVPEPVPAPPPVERAELRIGSHEAQSLEQGAVVATQRDAARLALRKARVLVLGESRLALTELAAQRTRLTLEAGSVVVEAKPDEPGELAVSASSLEAVVVGTRFLVSHAASGAVHVAVSEGMVRVRAGRDEQVLLPGQASTWQRDALTLRGVSRAEARTLARDREQSRPPPRRAPIPQPLPAPLQESAPLAPEPAPEVHVPSLQPPAPAPEKPSDLPQVVRKHRPGMLLPRPPGDETR